jgi:WD repeat-containing protein 1 (actin-interacting protein 1)
MRAKAKPTSNGVAVAGDPKTDLITYCTDRIIIICRLDAPLDVWALQDHAYPTTVACFFP